MSNHAPQDLQFSCHVCGRVWQESDIAVASHDLSDLWGFPAGTVTRNVRYCAHDMECERVARDSEFARRPFEDLAQRSES